jgi:hypothetical protein
MPRHRIHELSTDPPECDYPEENIEQLENDHENDNGFPAIKNVPDLWEPGEKP